jgi:hypothetical protein
MQPRYPKGFTPDFRPTPKYLLGPFDTYDREETLGKDLNKYDPNMAKDVSALFEERLVPAWSERNGYTAKHRWQIAKSVAEALADPGYDFAALLADDHEEHFYLPSDWNIVNPRAFFRFAYGLLIERWSSEWDGNFPALPTMADIDRASNTSLERAREG